MRMQVCKLCIVLVALALWCVNIPGRVAAEEVFQLFDFNDGVMPAELDVLMFPAPDPITATLDYDASSGQLRVYDTVSASCGVEFRSDHLFTDTSVSSMVTPDGGYLRNTTYLFAHGDGTEEPASNFYLVWLKPSFSGTGVRMEMYKYSNGIYTYQAVSPYIYAPGPYLMEFDVADVDVEGDICTDVTARLTYDSGQASETLYYRDCSQRVLSGIAGFGTYLNAEQRNAGWKLNVSFDDVTIRGTLVPEPNVVLLVFMGTVLLAWRRGE